MSTNTGTGVNTVRSAGQSWSSYWTTRTPDNLSVIVISNTQINGSFTINGSGQDGHKVYISTDNITFMLKATLSGSTNTFNATGLSANTLYYFYVKGYKGTSESPASSTVSATTWTDGENIIRTGNTVALYDSQDLSTITKDGSNFVSRWNDKLGSGHDLLQASGTNQPLWDSEGILFDGIDNFMQTDAFTYNQPEFIYAVLKQVTWTLNDEIFSGINVNGGSLAQYSTANKLRIYSPNYAAENSQLGLDTYAIVRVLFNGASSLIQINNTAATTGNPGANNMGGIVFGKRAGASFYSHIKVKEVIARNIADSAGNQTAIYNYLALKYGFSTI